MIRRSATAACVRHSGLALFALLALVGADLARAEPPAEARGEVSGGADVGASDPSRAMPAAAEAVPVPSEPAAPETAPAGPGPAGTAAATLAAPASAPAVAARVSVGSTEPTEPPASASTDAGTDASASASAASAAPEGGTAAAIAAPARVADGDSAREARTRFVIGIKRHASYRISSLTNPNRVVIDVDDTAVRLPAPITGPSGLVASFRGGLSALGKSRIVIDVTAPVVVKRSNAVNAVSEHAEGARWRRLVFDLVRTSTSDPVLPHRAEAAEPGASAGLNPPIPQRTTRKNIAAAHVFKPTIVIDPGHGGNDTGAIGSGTVEKEVVLAFALRLKDKLEASRRYKVMMTRDTDVFVELDERRLFAERNKAALFIAIHADSSESNSNARGATIYSLRQSVAEDLKETAKGEARKQVLSPDTVGSIGAASTDAEESNVVRGFLADLTEREIEINRDRTTVFTHSIIESMGRSTSLKDEPDRTAQFRVLKTAKLPSVLIELAYVSNQEDAANLRSEAWRDKVAQSIETAIENYFAHNIASLPM